METIILLGTALALGMDAFAVAAVVSAGLSHLTGRHIFRLTWHFGLFQALMTLFGWFGGEGLATFMAGANHWIAFGLLTALGLNMIRQSGHPEDRVRDYDPTRGWSLVALSVATSVDAFAVGVSLGLLNVAIPKPALIIGVVALLMTYVGTQVGRRAETYLGKWAERLGGIVLIAMGVEMLLQHMLS